MPKTIDISGKKFGRLTVVKLSGRKLTGRKEFLWLCECHCGNSILVPKTYLTSGDTKSCGCLALEIRKSMHLKHGMNQNRVYRIWASMKGRCFNEKNHAFKNYGGRGITVCKSWTNDFMVFYRWAMTNGYKDNLEIDRINNNKGYYPSNCRWATKSQQSLNRRSNSIHRYNGESKTVTEWGRMFGIDSKLLFSRIKRGWSIKEAIRTPILNNQFDHKKNLAKSKQS